MSRAVDTAGITRLRNAGLTVAVDKVPVSTDGKTVTLSVPYLAWYSNVGEPANYDLVGRSKSTVTEFQVTYVGVTREQAKWAGEKARTELTGTKLAPFGRPRVVESQRVREDTDARVLVNGEYRTLFYGADIYRVA